MLICFWSFRSTLWSVRREHVQMHFLIQTHRYLLRFQHVLKPEKFLPSQPVDLTCHVAMFFSRSAQTGAEETERKSVYIFILNRSLIVLTKWSQLAIFLGFFCCFFWVFFFFDKTIVSSAHIR